MPSSGPHTGQRSLGGGATATASNAMVVLGPVGAVYESASAATKALPEESISSRSASSTPVGKQLAETIIFLLSTRDEGLSICPSEVAHKMATTPSATAALRPSPFSSRIPSRSGSSGGASIPATFNSHDDLREDQLEVPPGTALLASGVAIAPVQNAGIAWRDLLPQIRTCAIELAKSGVICVTQGHSDRWHEVDLSNEQVLGPIRLRRGPNFEPVPAE
ncbi:hypothetical protein K437DRAFT_261424 [Tilletiaria anomala UBC 951]|uniref:Uncharacterized protein n=1 Tax=Tilletiaria anomala (strain ATCC 24038 / CBS 436.72 / UBC 951) TaxID=1037660 RepID=A0A066WIH7_TILAU|nr:uncharacterized protein K437DRAFT_261424 [Tilletiaria anomala UBC 951]KDN52323.1 hypothetical protein K437DRAFT_261424 [Tilletiaria anomala UBC 951]